MDSTELCRLISSGENSTIEFKRDSEKPPALAKEIVAFLNSHGGRLLIGVEDNGDIAGLRQTQQKAEERIMNICRNNIEPAFVPLWRTVLLDNKPIGIVEVPGDSANKPYCVKQGNKYYMRVGSTSQECSREELGRLFGTSPIGKSFESKPIAGATIDDVDFRRIYQYMHGMRAINTPTVTAPKEWIPLLVNNAIMDSQSPHYLTVAGTVLFAAHPNRFLKQAGITAIAYAGQERSSAVRGRKRLNIPLTRLDTAANELLEPGLVEETLAFLRQHIGIHDTYTEGRRVAHWDYPETVLREVIVNALIHRDYSLPSDVMLEIYPARIEIGVPGGLLNSTTIEGIKSGQRAVRNQTIVDIMADYGYSEGGGRGISNIVIPQMQKYNNHEPTFIADKTHFQCILYRKS